MAIQTFAAIDVGSFEVELGIYEISNKNGIRPIDHVRHVIALGKDTSARERSAMIWWRNSARCSRIFR